MLDKLKEKAKGLKGEIAILYLAIRHPKTPFWIKIFAYMVVAYALSPIDLIPDFIPILGYLDDLILLPLGITLVIKGLPEEVLEDCRASYDKGEVRLHKSWGAASIIILFWLYIIIKVI